MQCCGKDRVTKFCPDCGKRLEMSPLEETHEYLKSNVKRAETALAKANEARSAPQAEGVNPSEVAKLNSAAIEAKANLDKWKKLALAQGQAIINLAKIEDRKPDGVYKG